MDHVNRFHTNDSWVWVRAEHVAVVVVTLGLLVYHRSEVNWVRGVAAFVLLDVIGYVPGAIAYRRARGGKIPAIYHHLYNLTHSYLVCGMVVGLWALAGDGFEWAMLAVPIHLSGDRGIFGNTYKPTTLPFEPAPMPAAGLAPDASGEKAL